MWAARSGCDKTTEELLNKQAALDHVNSTGDTSLHIASSYGNVRVMELLLNSGTNVGIQNNQGQSCLDVAVHSGGGDVALAIANNKRLVWKRLYCYFKQPRRQRRGQRRLKQ